MTSQIFFNNVSESVYDTNHGMAKQHMEWKLQTGNLENEKKCQGYHSPGQDHNYLNMDIRDERGHSHVCYIQHHKQNDAH
jgi:hypothetical protein